MGIIRSILLILNLFLVGSLLAQQEQDTSKIYNWKGRQVRYLKIEKGRTLYSLSKQYNVPQDTLIFWNPELESGLKAGMILRIPLPIAAIVAPQKASSKEEKKSVAPKPETKITENKAKEVIECIIQDSASQKRVMKIGLFLPFYINKDETIHSKSHIALDFYCGAQLALDSLARAGYNAKVFVYDSQNDTATIRGILKNYEVKELDLIIGPLYTSAFKLVADFAKKHKICAISPFSQNDDILEAHENVIKITPDQATLIENLSKELIKMKPAAKFILLRNSNEKDKAICNQISSAFKALSARTSYSELTYKSITEVIDSLDTEKENVIFFPSSVQVQVIDLVNKLAANKNDLKITLTGLQEWKDYENIDFDQLNNLNYTFASSYFPSFDSKETSRFREKFKNEYKSEPGGYAIQSYDLLQYSIPLLTRYGKDFYRCIENIPTICGISTCYHFNRLAKKSGLENNAIKIIFMKDYSFEVLFK